MNRLGLEAAHWWTDAYGLRIMVPGLPSLQPRAARSNPAYPEGYKTNSSCTWRWDVLGWGTGPDGGAPPGRPSALSSLAFFHLGPCPLCCTAEGGPVSKLLRLTSSIHQDGHQGDFAANITHCHGYLVSELRCSGQLAARRCSSRWAAVEEVLHVRLEDQLDKK
jgi:hypothetical protein